MFQPDSTLPTVPLRAAPWDLSGQGWIVVLRLPAGDPARTAFLRPQDAARLRSPFALLMYVDYAHSACGPYRELLYIPGHLPFEDGRRHYTIGRIVVSTWDSVVNGRRNWGIPKDRADFEASRDGNDAREESIVVRDPDGRESCALRFGPAAFAPRLPVPGGLVPEALRTLAQRHAGRTYYYAPASRGWVRPARLLEWRFDGERFADLRAAKVLATLRVETFAMRFPVARVVDRE